MGEPVCSVVIRADEQHRLVRSSRVVLILRCQYQACAGADGAAWVTVTNKPGAPGRTRSSRENRHAGKAGMSRPSLWFLPRAFFSHGGHGSGELPAFPAPSRLKRVERCITRTQDAPRDASGCLQ